MITLVSNFIFLWISSERQIIGTIISKQIDKVNYLNPFPFIIISGLIGILMGVFLTFLVLKKGKEKVIRKKENRKISSAELLAFSFVAIGILLPIFVNGTKGTEYAQTAAPFLSMAALILLYSANRMQKEELGLQRVELELQRKELKETRMVFKEQSETMNLQRFESTFFNMIAIHNDLVNSIIYKKKKSQFSSMSYDQTVTEVVINYNGREYFQIAYENLTYRLKENPHTKVEEIYEAFFDKNQIYIGHYFRNMYRIVKFVDEANLLYKEKKEYLGILKAQLSSFELVLLLYNGISKHGKKFLPLIKKYNLLDNINLDLVPDSKHFDSYTNEQSAINDNN
ncbi:putative phage abortive infection protein [Bacillus sp. FJAT-45350]|uniref:putative phage abortive infection protein n=1 Tax=Bacillus sp. FJAT-45350 TaxID=2011014 RepID=UPI000BB6F31C|nr:putative phage abortive infection protein [Bacillus sp. FJAT-45350]